MSQPKAFDELLQYIRILILDPDTNFADGVRSFLSQCGFPNVECSASLAEVLERLPTFDILIVDPLLHDGQRSSLESIKELEETSGVQWEVILWLQGPFASIQPTLERNSIVRLEKSQPLDALLSWVRECARRIWLEKVLDNIPDELIIIDPRPETFGRIHFANKAKRERFEQGKTLLYDYCWRRFERQNEGDRPCERCVSRNTLKEKHSVRTFWDYMDWQGRKESVDLHAVPISDRTGEIRGIIETCRDRTQLHIAQQYIQRIEATHAWKARLDLFLEGFQELGYPQARFYRRINKNGRDVFQGIRQVGMEFPFDITRFEIDAETDMPTKILLNERFPVLFVIKPNTGYVWEASKVYAHLYRVDERLVPYNDIFKKKRWVEIPVTANGELFAKVSADPVYNTRYISNYELEVLSYYASWAGQALANVERQEKLRLTSETNELIIQINQQISKRPVHRGWLFRSLERVCDVLHASSCSIFLLEGEGANRRLVRKSNFVRDRHGRNVEKKIGPEIYKIGQFLVGNVFKSGRNLIENNLIGLAEKCRSHSPKQMNLAAYEEFCRHIGEPVRNALFVVLRSEGRKIGVIRVINKKQSDIYGNRDFTTDDLKALEALAGQIALAYDTFNMVKNLRESQKLKEFIAAEYAHTMKNLLQPIVTLSGLLERDPSDKELWGLMAGEITRMKTTINTMLNLAQAESAELQLKKTPTSPADLLQRVVRPYLILAADKNMEIKLSISQKLPILEIDEMLIYDAVANLLDNAVKYGDAGKPILLSARLSRSFLLISVTDYGPQIPKEDRTRIFEKYYTGKGFADTIKQIGLGLTYVKTVAEAHGGKVYVDPKFKQGAKIVMKLPLQKAEEAG